MVCAGWCGGRWCRSPPRCVLSVGLAACTAAWTLVDAACSRPFGLRDSERLVVLWESDRARNQPLIEVSYLNFLDWQREARSLESMAAFGSQHWPALARIGAEMVPLTTRGIGGDVLSRARSHAESWPELRGPGCGRGVTAGGDLEPSPVADAVSWSTVGCGTTTVPGWHRPCDRRRHARRLCLSRRSRRVGQCRARAGTGLPGHSCRSAAANRRSRSAGAASRRSIRSRRASRSDGDRA